MDTRDSNEAQITQLWHSVRDELRRHGADAETAEDIAQDTWLIALRRPPNELGRFRGWLHVVAVRLWQRSRAREYDRVPRERAAARLGLDEEAPWDVESLEVSQLRKAVNELPEPYGTALRMRFFEGLEVSEIAERLSLKTTTVYTQIRRGLFRLRERLEPKSVDRRLGLGWLAWLRARIAVRSKASLRRLGAAFAVAAVLPLLLLWTTPSRPGPSLASTACTAGDSGALSASASLPPPDGSSALSRREAASSPAETASVARLSGIVLTPDGTPLAGALVHVGDDGGRGGERTTLSDERGRFEIVADGELVWATHRDWCESSHAYVASLPARERAELRLSPTRGRAWVEVVTHEGDPLALARVRLDVSKRSQQWTTLHGTLEVSGQTPGVTTDEDGRGSILFPEQPETEILVLAPGQAAWRRTVPTPAAGETLRIELQAPLVLTGVCLDEAGRRLAGARLELFQHAGLVRRETATDAEGCFRIDSLGSGEFVLRAVGGPRFGSAVASGRLAPEDERELTLKLGACSSISGLVVDEGRPVAGARVELETGSPQPADMARRVAVTDGRGRFRFAGCATELDHDLQVFLPGTVESCFGLGKLRPGGGEVRCEVPPPSAVRAPIELAFSGPNPPLLVELRRAYPALSVLLRPDPAGRGLLRSPPLPAGAYRVFAWSPELGIWEAPRLEHDPLDPEVSSLSMPVASTIAVELVLPEGFRRDEIDVQLLEPSFHRNGLSYYSTDNTRRSLPWRVDAEAFVGSLASRQYLLVVRGRGLSEVQQTIEVAPGAFRRLSLTPQRGIETTVFFESLVDPGDPVRASSRGLQLAETLVLEATTPDGKTSFELRWRDQRRVEGGFEFVIALPSGTTELLARTRSKAVPFAPREGRCALEREALAAPGRPRLRIPLQDAPF